jgi:hypothetical protein
VTRCVLRLLRVMDRPFHVEERTDDDVSLFLLRGFVRPAEPLAHLIDLTGEGRVGLDSFVGREREGSG